MPTPDRTSLAAIIAASREIIEEHGLAGLTMAEVGEHVGVRAPSLYKRISSRDALVALVATDAANDLAARLRGVLNATTGGPVAQLSQLAHALRAFARSSPIAYALIFTPASDAMRADRSAAKAATEPLMLVSRDLAGEQNALLAARTIASWASGFLSMELTDNFRFDGDVDAAFEFGIAHLAIALSASAG
jgi:AcrR family transcriptional regulator